MPQEPQEVKELPERLEQQGRAAPLEEMGRPDRVAQREPLEEMEPLEHLERQVPLEETVPQEQRALQEARERKG